MAKIKLDGKSINTIGSLPKIGAKAPSFILISNKLEKISLAQYKGKKKILNIVPSIDTSVCSLSVSSFEKHISKGIVLLTISRDTPFALTRFCKVEKIKKGITLSDMSHTFGSTYGVEIISGPLKYFLARAVIVLDINNKVIYTELVPEIKKEPDYKKAIASLQ